MPETGYLATVERFFVSLRRRGVVLSAADVDRVEAWERAHVPVEVVCRGLDRAARTYRDRHGEEAAPPHSLAWYAPFVDEELERLRAEVAPARSTTLVAAPSPVTAGAEAGLAGLSDQARARVEDEVERRLAPERAGLGVRGIQARREAILEDVLEAEYARASGGDDGERE